MATKQDSVENLTPISADFSVEAGNFDAKNDRNSTIDLEEDKLHEMTASYSEISFDSQPSPVDASIVDDQGFSVMSPSTSTYFNSGKRKADQFDDILPDGSETRRPDSLNLRPCKNEPGSSSMDVQGYHKALEDLHLEGTVTQEGDMVLFVAEDLESKIKLASPVSKRGETPTFPGSRSTTPNLYRKALMPQIGSVDVNVLNDLEAEARRLATSVDTLTENLAGILHSVSALTVDCLETYRDAVCKTCDAVDSNIKAMYQLMAKCEELSKSMKSIYKLSDQVKEIKRLLDLFESVVNN